MTHRTAALPGLVLALAGLLAAPPLAGPAAAQQAAAAEEEAWRPEAGDRSVAFSLPAGGGSGIGLWWARPEGRAFGLHLQLGLAGALALGGSAPDQYSVSTGTSLGLAWKRYALQDGPVEPYLYTGTGISASWFNRGVDEPNPGSTSGWSAGVYGQIGSGVDWFPLERISIGGHVGARLSYSFSPGLDSTARADDARRHEAALSLLTSGLTLQFYF